MSLDVLRSTYFPYGHSITSYGIVFWGIHLIVNTYLKFKKDNYNSSKNTSCRQLFRDLNILPIQSQYIHTTLLFVTENKDQFLSKSQVHKINTKQTSDLYVPTINMAVYQKGVCYSGIKIYNHLPTAIKDLSGDKNKLKLALKGYLLHSSFYITEEYFNT
jgi:hypothetical protein